MYYRKNKDTNTVSLWSDPTIPGLPNRDTSILRPQCGPVGGSQMEGADRWHRRCMHTAS